MSFVIKDCCLKEEKLIVALDFTCFLLIKGE